MSEIFVDGGHSKQSGTEAWGSVMDSSGKDLLENNNFLLTDVVIKKEKLPRGERNVIVAKFNDVTSQQNNGAELLAFYAGLKIALQYGHKIINCDSQLLVEWWGKGHVNSAKAKTMDPNKYKFILACGELRKLFEKKGGKIVKISGDKNIADLFSHYKG